MEEIRFDDVEALQKHVSEEFGEFGEPVEISQEMVNQFAEVTGDHQWIHIDVERCKKESPFGCLLYTSPSPRDGLLSRMPSSA